MARKAEIAQCKFFFSLYYKSFPIQSRFEQLSSLICWGVMATQKRGVLYPRLEFVSRDRPIYRPIFGFYRYIGQYGRYYRPQQKLTKRCYIPHSTRQLAQENTTKQVETVILQQRYQVRFPKQTDKINHVSAITTERRASSGSFAMLEATMCRCCV